MIEAIKADIKWLVRDGWHSVIEMDLFIDELVGLAGEVEHQKGQWVGKFKSWQQAQILRAVADLVESGEIVIDNGFIKAGRG
jgi:hypothetical protein